LSVDTPVEVDNRPGLSAIAYRAGTYAQFKETMLARLSTSEAAALGNVTTRDDDDFTIALLDAWATVCDVLTFYQERIVNENYLRTATELFSVVELARLINYKLQPGVAASVDLAFTLEDAPGALGQALGVGTTAQIVPSPPLRLVIEAGTKAQSIAGPGEQAQTFETVTSIEARADWNAMRPRSSRPQKISTSANTIILRGAAINLKAGDTLLIAASKRDRVVKKALRVTVDDEAKLTRVDFALPPPPFQQFVRPTDLPKGDVESLSTRKPLTAHVVTDEILGKTWSGDDLAAVVAIQGWDAEALATNVAKQIGEVTLSPDLGVFVLRQRAAVFGHNAPKYLSLAVNLRFSELDKDLKRTPLEAAFPQSWDKPPRTLDQDAGPNNNFFVFLDNLYPGIAKGSWAALLSPSLKEPATTLVRVVEVKDNVETTQSEFAISAKVSRLTVEAVEDRPPLGEFRMRTTTVLAQSEQLVPAELPIPNLIEGDSIMLNRLLLGLKTGQSVVVTGERSDLKGAITSESMKLKAVTIEAGFTVLTFETALVYKYLPGSVTINANVAQATHGESVEESLGSGDGSQAFQHFTLRQPPLTYVSAAVPAGALSTLGIRVNDLLWREAPTFFDRGPNERIYITRTDDQGRTTIRFGDGITGARLPSGQENIRAKYRKGTGVGGNLPGDRLTQLMTRPLGLKGVTNPLAATGGADQEGLADARKTAPIAILTLGRIVSLQDYEDFARAFAGIAKALATWTWSGNTRGVFITVAGSGGAAVDTGSRLYKNLVNAIFGVGDPTVSFSVASYTPRFFRLAAGVQIDPNYINEKVIAAVTEELRKRFSFDARDFGQPVTRGEVVTVIQNVRGVVAVDLDKLYRTDQQPGLNDVLGAGAPQPGAETAIGAELLTLDARPIRLEVLP
jgi:predicted phage baseplate assembly protein